MQIRNFFIWILLFGKDLTFHVIRIRIQILFNLMASTGNCQHKNQFMNMCSPFNFLNFLNMHVPVTCKCWLN